MEYYKFVTILRFNKKGKVSQRFNSFEKYGTIEPNMNPPKREKPLGIL